MPGTTLGIGDTVMSKMVLLSQAFSPQQRWSRGRETSRDHVKFAVAGVGGGKDSEKIPGKKVTSKQLSEGPGIVSPGTMVEKHIPGGEHSI